MVLGEGATLIGRDRESHLLLDNLTISRLHAILTRRGGELWIEDQRSAHGTLINGTPAAEKSPLRLGDQVVIGGVTLEVAFRFEAAVPTAAVGGKGGMPLEEPSRPPFEEDVFLLNVDRITFGRAPDRDIVLPNPLISRRHAVLERRDGQFFLSDAQSQIGTHVNGGPIIRARLTAGDVVQIGPYLFRFEKTLLRPIRRPTCMEVVALDLRREVNGLVLLDGISLVLKPGEFVGLLGPSGAGKSTLLGALLGQGRLNAGQVLINGESLHENHDRLRRHLGYVPQDDILHTELTSRQALDYAARLRLPADLSPQERRDLVEQTLVDLDLNERADVPIGRLSGGQRKRASIGVELLSKPGILFLDEPTSGLDPATEARLMQQFARLARQGRTVVCTTHVMENIDLFDRIAVLAPGGRLAYFGNPNQAKTYFAVEKFTLLYDRLEETAPAEWQERFRQSPLGAKPLKGEENAPRSPTPESVTRNSLAEAFRQTITLTRRFGQILFFDKQNVLLLFAQPLLIAGLISLVCQDMPLILFLLVIAGLWFGCSNAAQQLVRERSIYRRERMVNLRLDTYLLSKFIPLAVVSAAQCTLMLILVWLFERWEGNVFSQWITLMLTSWNGVALGLIVSAVASSGDKAMALVPLTLLPQIIFAGVMVPLPTMNTVTQFLSQAIITRWANQGMEVSILNGKLIEAEMFVDSSSLRPLMNLYPEYDMNVPAERVRFLAEQGGKKVTKCVLFWQDSAVLTVFLLFQLAMVGWCLKRQDPV